MPYAFIHIPKNAGRSCARTILDHTGLTTSPNRLMAMYFRNPIGSYQFYGGHTFYATLKDMLPPDTKYFTMLRDPINRTYSHWSYLIRTGEIAHYGQARNITFSEFIRNPSTRNLASNFQCRYITLPVERPPDNAQRLKWQITIEQSDFEASAEKAIEVLHSFIAVGIQERFAASIREICVAMGYSPPIKVNEKKIWYYDRINREDMDCLLEMNREDFKLYNAYT